MIVASSSMLLDDEPAGQSLYGEETAEVSAESSVSDEQPPECVPFGRSPPFNLASEFFELLTGLRSKGGSGHRGPMEKKRAWMEQMFKKWRQEVGNDLYPLARLLLPERDRYRQTYGIKEKVLAKIYIQILGLSPKSSAAEKLIHWKQPTKQSMSSGDFAEVVFQEIQLRSTVERSDMTIDEVNDQLDLLSRTNKLDAKARVMQLFHDRLTPLQQKWLIRIILKDLKISLGEKLVLSCIHPDAMQLFNLCSDLRAVCWKLWDPTKPIPKEETTIKLFYAFRPMLACRFMKDFNEIAKVMGSTKTSPKAFLIEEKLDGERMQLHKKGEEYRYVSRSDKDYTYLYGTHRAEEGALTPFIHHCFLDKVEEIILDGEMVVREPSTGRYLPFGNLKTTAKDHLEKDYFKRKNGPTVCFKVFDILYAKGPGEVGRSLLDEPLKKRLEVMKALVKPEYARLEFAEGKDGHSAQDIKDELGRILDKQGEGLVVKNYDSLYSLNTRDQSWVKVKPDYMDALGEELDLVVMGGLWGSGRRGGILGSFMCGLVDRTDPDHPKYLSFCKVGSGFSIADFEEIAERKKGKWREWKKGMEDPNGLIFGQEKPDVWIAPEDSFILEVKAAEITPDALNYGAEVCLRFPRVQKIQWDRDLSYCHEYKPDLIALARTRQREVGDVLSKRRSAMKARKKVKTSVAANFQGAKISDDMVVSDIFEGLTFYIVNGPRVDGKDVAGQTKQDLEKMVVAGGGKRFQVLPKDRECYLICDRMNFLQIKTIVQRAPGGDHDVIHPNWILHCVAAGERIPLTKDYYVNMTPETAARVSDGSAEEDEEEDEGEVRPSGHGRSMKRGAPTALKKDDASSGEGSEKDFSSTSRGVHHGHREVKEESDGETTDDGKGESDDEDEEKARKMPWSFPPGIPSDEEEESKPKGPSSSGIEASTGEDHFDEEYIFKHLTFYLDTSHNAKANGLKTAKAGSDSIEVSEGDRKLQKAGQQIKEGGGRLIDSLDDPTLTHIVVGLDASRLTELSRRTREPRARRIVNLAWVEESVEMESLQEESLYKVYAG